MSSLNFTVALKEDPKQPGNWMSTAFQLPGVRILQWLDADRGMVQGVSWSDGNGHAPSGVFPSFAVVEVPGDLTQPSVLEAEKLKLEREKMLLAEQGARRNWIWGIGGAVLTAVVTLCVALINKPADRVAPIGPVLNADTVAACRDSLQRLPLLAKTTSQTVGELAQAIDVHVQQCDGLLVQVMSKR